MFHIFEMYNTVVIVTGGRVPNLDVVVFHCSRKFENAKIQKKHNTARLLRIFFLHNTC